MKNAILSILEGIHGGLSSKRFALFIFVLAFLGEHVMFYAFGKTPDATLRDELFYTMSGLIVAVFGEGALGIVKGVPPKLMPDPEQGAIK